MFRRRPTLPQGLPSSTIGAGGLNYCVRNGNRCDPSAIATETLVAPACPPTLMLAPGMGLAFTAPRQSEAIVSQTTKARCSIVYHSIETDVGRCTLVDLYGQVSRLISTGRLKRLLSLHLRPIYVVVYNEPSGGINPRDA